MLVIWISTGLGIGKNDFCNGMQQNRWILENRFITFSKKRSISGTVIGIIKILISGYDAELFGE